MDEDLLLEQVADLVGVEGVLDHLREAGADVGLVAVADRLDQELAQWSALELHLAQHIEDLAAEGGARFLELREEGAVDVALAGFVGDEIP